MPSLQSRAPLLAVALLAAALAGCDRERPTPGPLEVEPDVYARVVSAFYTGLDALSAGDNEGAVARFQVVTELVPDEPAGWANLGLAQLRRGDLEASETALTRARELLPASGDVALMRAMLAERQGKTDEIAATLREAIRLDEGNLRARYGLTKELARAGVESDAETRAQLDAILQARPENLAALLDLARLAAKTGDAAGLAATLERLAARSEAWAEDTRARLVDARAAAGRGDARAAGQPLALVGNLLLVEPAFQADLAALQTPSTEVGTPMAALVRLPPPQARPDPADVALHFEAAPSAGAAWQRALALDAEGPPTTVLPAEGGLALAGRSGEPLAFPGPAAAAPPDGILAADLDNDRLPDLALAGPEGLKLYRQSAPGAWADVTGASGLEDDVLGAAYVGVWAADVDLEGDLDLVLGTPSGPPPVLVNGGDGTWTVSRPFAELDGLAGFVWADLDGDGDPDVAAVEPGGALVVLSNERNARYLGVPLAADGSMDAAAAVSVADPNQDGRLDLVWLAPDGAVRRGQLTATGWEVQSLVTRAASAGGAARLLWGDLDNNGAQDLVLSAPTSGQVWLAGEDGGLAPLGADPGAHVLDLADLDADGRLDLAGATADGVAAAWTNRGGAEAYRWHAVRPRAVAQGDQRINSFGVGGQMTSRAGRILQTQPIAGPTVHFGLGAAAAADGVRILWPNGTIQAEFDLAADQTVVAEQRLKGSCPWLFAHDGTGLAFVTDVLWRSPLGLRINAQDTAGVVQTRDWVRVRGDQLVARDGQYDLRVTAELWETHFFDEVGLMVVDHPPDVEVRLDERFAIPPPPLEVVAVSGARSPSRAVDEAGRLVTTAVAARDGRYLGTFALGRFQGIAADHFVELDLASAARALVAEAAAAGRAAPRLVLVGEGWIYPTDSSINVAVSQGRHAPPRGLAIEVPDGEGGWKVAREGLGFPAGKTKTVLLDLGGLDAGGAPAPDRLRLSTNLEIYWDRLALAELRPDAPLEVRWQPLASAELLYRGFSRTSAADGAPRSVPETPRYEHPAGAAPQWLDLAGFYTRFGDVRPLLLATDDRYVIMNAGDELALRFEAAPPPAGGRVRDYVFMSDGWEKDGDFNTSTSATVLPLPSHDHPEYADPGVTGPTRLADDPVYRRHAADWLTYHTRYVTPVRPEASMFAAGDDPKR